MTTLEPLRDRVILKPDPADGEKQTAGGIVLPAGTGEKNAIGTVAFVGPGQDCGDHVHPVTLRPGDRVLYNRYAGTAFKSDGEQFVVLAETDVLARIAPRAVN